jgi:hypothetical protein
MMCEVEGLERLISEGRRALERGDAASARAAFEPALVDRTCGDTLAGLAEALFLERDYATCKGLFERAYAAYRQEHNPLGAYHAARIVARFCGGMDGEWALYNGWMGRARSMLEEAPEDSAERGRLELRKPYGPGWVLVGDAGYHKDPVTAQGISDAFRDVELVVDGLDDVFSGRQTFNETMSRYQKTRDEHVLPMYDFTCQMATMEPPPPEIAQVLGAVSTNRDASDAFASMIAGTLPVPEFFSPENIGRIMAAV